MSALGIVSRFINMLMLGHPRQTLCARIAMAFGRDCMFCRVISRLLSDPDHCGDEAAKWIKTKR